jgi:hypothetical protein
MLKDKIEIPELRGENPIFTGFQGTVELKLREI